MWFTLKKGSETVHVEYSHGGATLFVENVQLQPDDPFDISLDLNKNLRSRNKQENTYVDANDLASEMDTLKSVQITDATAIDGIRKALGRMEQKQSLPK